MTLTYSWMGGALLAASVAAALGWLGVPLESYPKWSLWAGGAVLLGIGTFAWGYSPLPDSNGGMAASRFRGRYWGWSPPPEMTTEEFVCRGCGHGPMLFDTRAADLHHRFEENEKDWLAGRTIMYVGRCEDCGKKIGWRDKAENPAPDPPEGYSDPSQYTP